VPLRWKIIEKETIDKIIFRTTKVRNRLILELMARGGMRIGEVLKLRWGDLQDRKLVLREPKSGKEYEFVLISQKVVDRLREYALEVCNSPNDRIFPNSYEAARMMVIKSGKLDGVKLHPQDLRRHSATYASRFAVPIEIISKVILRHANLSITQRYMEPSAILKRPDGLRTSIAKSNLSGSDLRVHPIKSLTQAGYCLTVPAPGRFGSNVL
jgi:integrase